MKILVIPGSLRQGSFNKSLARHILKIAPKDIDFEMFLLNDIPMFNADLEQKLPQIINELLSKIEEVDGLIISTPEYNNMLPAPVMNLFHWLSREYSRSLVRNKPLGIMGVSDGSFGTVRAQNELLLMATIVGMKTNAIYRMPVPMALEIFDKDGNVTDMKMLKRIEEFLKIYIDWVKST